MSHTIGTKGLIITFFALFHRHNGSNHLDKTNAYDAIVIQYEIIPRTLSKMEHEFHLQICKG